MFTPLESLVLATVAYTAQFDYPLSEVEICQRCLSVSALKTVGLDLVKKTSSVKKSAKISTIIVPPKLKDVVETVQGLVKKKALKTDPAGSLWLALESSSQTQKKPEGKLKLKTQFELRLARQKLAKTRLTELKQLKRMLTASPWVLAAAITGSAAMANGTKKSDLDVMIITAPGRLWLARLSVLFLTWWYKHRNQTGWCFNLWLEPSELGLPPHRQGVYEAYELWQCYWLVDKASWRLAWIGRNMWFKQFLPLASLEPRFMKLKIDDNVDSQTGEDWPDWLGKLANSLTYLIQVHYRKWRHGESPAPRRQAFLHAPDSRAMIYARWQSRLNQLGLIN